MVIKSEKWLSARTEGKLVGRGNFLGRCKYLHLVLGGSYIAVNNCQDTFELNTLDLWMLLYVDYTLIKN